MITAAIVVAGESTAAEAHEFLAAMTGATDAGVGVVPLFDAPGAVVLHALPDGSPDAPDGLTLVLFCGHIVRDYDGRLFFSSRADEPPTPRTAVPIDAVRDVIRTSRQPTVVIFDCTFADDERSGAGADRLGALEQSFAGLAVGVLVSNVRSMGLDGGLTRRLAEGIASRDADLDRDGVVTIDELFAYARRRVEQVAIAQHCITSSSRAGRMAVVQFSDPNLFDDDVQFSVYRPRAVQPEVEYGMLVFAHKAGTLPVEGLASAGAARAAPTGRRPVLRFVPYVEGIEFDPPDQPFRWRGDVFEASFRLRASRAVEGRRVRGQVSVFHDAVLIADVRLSIAVDGYAAMPEDAGNVEVERARPYRNLFVSYSHSDLAVVEQVAAIEQMTGDGFVHDWSRLRARAEWDPRLLEFIDEADVFQLFWSRNSMYSPDLRQEWEYALSLQRPSFVRPVYWEEPLPSDDELPPPDLERAHFQRVDFRSLSSAPPPPVATPLARTPPGDPAPAAPAPGPPPSPTPPRRGPTPGTPAKRRPWRPIAVIGIAALGGFAVFGALLRGGTDRPRASPPTTVFFATTPTSFVATGNDKLSPACTRGPDRFAAAIATNSSAARPVVSATLRVDTGPDIHVALVRAQGTVTAPEGVGLYVGDVATFARVGTLHWSVQVSEPASVRSVAMQCATTVQVLSH